MNLRTRRIAFALVIGAITFSFLGAGHRDGSAQVEAEVSRDSLVSLVRFLSADPATSTPRSRFALREESISLIADSLASRLGRYLSTTVVRMPFQFEATSYAPDSSFSNDNIIALLAGNGSIDGAFLVSAHYDAIASNDENWLDTWQSHPAPGANDNATGVAALFEIVRVLSNETLPFDCIFVLFGAEELNLIGSYYFTEHFEMMYDREILGVLNVDMIGHREAGAVAGTQIISNYRSGWLADLALGSIARTDPTLVSTLMKPGVPYYDHKPFWDTSINAITFTEPFDEDLKIMYPYYHSSLDTVGQVDFEQVERISEAVANLLLEASDSPAELALTASDFHLYWMSGITSRREFEVGDTITIQARPRNIGSEAAPMDATFRLMVSIETRNGVDLLYSDWLDPPAPFHNVPVDIPLVLGERCIGGNVIRASIAVQGVEDDLSNNDVRETIGVAGGAEVLLGHHFQPNPIRGPFDSAVFCINLSAEANAKVEIFNLEGELIGKAFLGYGSGVPLETGLNCFDCNYIFPEVRRLASGVYPYRVVLFDKSGPVKSSTGLFAVEN
jgi:hypothetical protein